MSDASSLIQYLTMNPATRTKSCRVFYLKPPPHDTPH